MTYDPAVLCLVHQNHMRSTCMPLTCSCLPLNYPTPPHVLQPGTASNNPKPGSAAAAAGGPPGETPAERLKRIMAAQINKAATKDSVVATQKKLQVGGGWGGGLGRAHAWRSAVYCRLRIRYTWLVGLLYCCLSDVGCA